MERLLSAVLALTLLMPAIGSADVSIPQSGKNQPDQLIGPTIPNHDENGHHTTFTGGSTVLNWETGAGRSYLIPAGELLAYLFLLNQYDRHFSDPKSAYRTDGDTIWQHLTDSKWVLDNDQFSVN